MTELRKRMIECLQLRGLSERTQKAYVRAMRQLSEHPILNFGEIFLRDTARFVAQYVSATNQPQVGGKGA